MLPDYKYGRAGASAVTLVTPNDIYGGRAVTPDAVKQLVGFRSTEWHKSPI